VLANPTLKFTGEIRATKLYPSPLPDLFKGEQLVLVGRYTGKGDAAVIVEGTVNGAAKKFTYETKFAGEASESEFIPRLWATRRVGYLLDEIRLHGENSELRDEVTELARKYGIVTPYTAYLILEDETHRNVPMPMRSLQSFDMDGSARMEAAKAWDEFKVERGGEKAVAGARYGLALKAANAPASAAVNGAVESRRALGLSAASGGAPAASPTDRSRERLVQYSQQAQFVAGKSFFQNDKQWIDSDVQKHPKAKRVRIQFGSVEYFELVAKNAKALPWLALGQNVQFILDDTFYDIYE
jgi:Ca-activated chloride channel family protein